MIDFLVTVQPPSTNSVVVNPVTNAVTVTQTTNIVEVSSSGVAGVGIPAGGTAGQVLSKVDGTDYNTQWTNQSGGVTSFNSRTGAVTSTSGDYTTAQVTESGSLYFTNARAIASTLTGYTSGSGAVSSADSILSAIQKLDGNVGLRALLSGATFTGAISATNLSGTNTGNVTLTAVGASPSANAASLSGQALTLQPVDSTHPGVMTAAQYNTMVAKQTSVLATNKFWIGSGSSVAVASGLSASSDITSMTYDGTNTDFTVGKLDGHSYLNNGYTADTVVGRDGSGWIYAESIQLNGAGSGSIYGIKTLADKDDITFADLNGVRQYFKTDGNTALDLDNGVFSNGTDNATIDVLTGILTAADGSTSLDFKNHNLVDPTNTTVLHWEEDVLEIAKKVTSYNGEATQGNGVPAIVGYLEDLSVSSFDLTPYTAVVDSTVRISVSLEIEATGDPFDVLIDYTTAAGSYTHKLMSLATMPSLGVVLNSVVSGQPGFKNGSVTAIIPCKASNSIRVYSANFTGSNPTMSAYVTVEKLN